MSRRGDFRLLRDVVREQLATPGLSPAEQAELYLEAGRADHNLGDLDEALADGESAYVLAKVALAAAQEQADADLYDLFGKAIINSGVAYDRAALYHKALNRWDEFRQYRPHFNEAARHEAVVLYNQGTAYRSLNQLSQAIDYVRRAYQLAQSEENLVRADRYRSTLVSLYLKQEQADAALQLIEEGDRYQPDDPAELELHNLRQKIDRALYSIDQERYEDAYDLCVEALAVNPDGIDPKTIIESKAVILFALHRIAAKVNRSGDAISLAVFAAEHAVRAARRDLECEIRTSALEVAQGMTASNLDEIMAQLRKALH